MRLLVPKLTSRLKTEKLKSIDFRLDQSSRLGGLIFLIRLSSPFLLEFSSRSFSDTLSSAELNFEASLCLNFPSLYISSKLICFPTSANTSSWLHRIWQPLRRIIFKLKQWHPRLSMSPRHCSKFMNTCCLTTQKLSALSSARVCPMFFKLRPSMSPPYTQLPRKMPLRNSNGSWLSRRIWLTTNLTISVQHHSACRPSIISWSMLIHLIVDEL